MYGVAKALAESRVVIRQSARRTLRAAGLALALSLCGQTFAGAQTAQKFIQRAERELAEAEEANQHTQWAYQTHITHDTEWLAARSQETLTRLNAQFAREAARYSGRRRTPALDRALSLLRLSVRSPAPVDPAEAREWSTLQSSLVSRYNRHTVSEGDQVLRAYSEVRRAMETTRDPAALERLWRGWHEVGRDLHTDYVRFVSLSRAGAKSLGFADVGELWRSTYDMSPEEMAADVDRLWIEVKPLYDQLHCYARTQMNSAYGENVQPGSGPISIELTRNPMGMYWVGAFDIIASDLPAPSYNLDTILASGNPGGRKMAEYADRFWSSMGLAPMPETFWQRSLFERPRDRDVACSGSAAIIDGRDDVRIKMCVQPNALDFTTLHHEVGHAFYARAYQDQPYLFRGSANEAFHEAVADLGALSITPGYLQSVGLISPEEVPGPEEDLGLLMGMALQRVTFMPFALIVDKWRWQVFSGEVAPGQYDASWWELVGRYQGLAPRAHRAEGSFDAAALPHVTSNISYIRYFYAYLIEFQMFQAACERAGWAGPLHRCSLYGDTENGALLNTMMAMGASEPWQDALETFTGARTVSASGMLEYFRPLQEYLETENNGRACGW